MKENLEDWIGNTVVREDAVSPRIVSEYRATMDPYLFKPTDAAHAPPGLHWCLAVAEPLMSELGPDGAEAKGAFLPPVPLPRRMWAGGQIETFHPLIVGAKVIRTSKVSDVKLREGKAGPLCFVSVTHELECAGRLALRERHDLVFKEAGKAQPPSPRPLPQGDLVWRVEASPVLLFRFSAITFNGHRIHYDLRHATETEGLTGLLVHGPLQAAFLLNQISALRGSVPDVFSYRCTAPLIAGRAFHVASTRGGGVIANGDGVTTIAAQAP